MDPIPVWLLEQGIDSMALVEALAATMAVVLLWSLAYGIVKALES